MNSKERAKIKSGWLSYTCRCGWIDWGHALPDGPAELKAQLDAESVSGSNDLAGRSHKRKDVLTDWDVLNIFNDRVTLNGQPAFIVKYGQSMGKKPLSIGDIRHWIVRRNLNAIEREQVGLGIFMAASMDFEAMQGEFPFSIITGGSSFSPEDLVSNLIGFYSAFRGVKKAAIRTLCRDVGKDASYDVLDTHLPNGLSGYKRNHNFKKPIFFNCASCKDSSDTSFPAELASLVAAPQGRLYVKARRPFVPSDRRAINALETLDYDSSGLMRFRAPS